MDRLTDSMVKIIKDRRKRQWLRPKNVVLDVAIASCSGCRGASFVILETPFEFWKAVARQGGERVHRPSFSGKLTSRQGTQEATVAPSAQVYGD
jgi:hypothetical protein